MSYTRTLEPRVFRARFGQLWQGFLRENYRNPEHVSVEYGVRYQTAVNWWNGFNRPSGDVVALAYEREPEAMNAAMRGLQ